MNKQIRITASFAAIGAAMALVLGKRSTERTRKMLKRIPAPPPLSRAGRGTLRHACLALAGPVLATNVAMAQNWVASGPLGKPVIPFDAIVAGWDPVVINGLPEPLYVCRGSAGQVGRFRADFTGCDFGYGGREITDPDFKFLVTSWQDASSGSVPSNAVIGGWDAGSPWPPLYYCRAHLAGSDLEPGKIRPGFPGCLIPYGGVEQVATYYQVLVSLSPAMPLTTVVASGGYVPPDAIRGGTDNDGTPLYLCTAVYGGGSHPGKLKPAFKGCDVSYGGGEHVVASYSVLVPKWVKFAPSPPWYLDFDFPAGTDTSGLPLYVCRAYFGLGVYPGKMQATWTACNFGWGGTEQHSTDFDVLSDIFELK